MYKQKVTGSGRRGRGRQRSWPSLPGFASAMHAAYCAGRVAVSLKCILRRPTSTPTTMVAAYSSPLRCRPRLRTGWMRLGPAPRQRHPQHPAALRAVDRESRPPAALQAVDRQSKHPAALQA
eukprot:309149-Chlamydomonas_euryale.AAC.1